MCCLLWHISASAWVCVQGVNSRLTVDTFSHSALHMLEGEGENLKSLCIIQHHALKA